MSHHQGKRPTNPSKTQRYNTTNNHTHILIFLYVINHTHMSYRPGNRFSYHRHLTTGYLNNNEFNFILRVLVNASWLEWTGGRFTPCDR